MTKISMPEVAKALLEEARQFEMLGDSEQHTLIAEFARRVASNLTRRHNENEAAVEAHEKFLDSLTAEFADPNS